jgi:hypothetical protein
VPGIGKPIATGMSQHVRMNPELDARLNAGHLLAFDNLSDLPHWISDALCRLLEAASHGLRTLSGVCLKQLPRMADFALWATACETVLWPAGTFMRAYEENRSAAIEVSSRRG